MLKVVCECGARLKLPPEHLGRAVSCPKCQKVMRAVSGGGEVEEFASRLILVEGPERMGEQLLLGGEGTIEIGKLETKHVRLLGAKVSRNHCRLIPTIDGGWVLEDERSTNGVMVNDQRIESHTLRNGDRVRVGDFVLEYACEEVVELGEGIESPAVENNRSAEADPTDDGGLYGVHEDGVLVAEEAPEPLPAPPLANAPAKAELVYHGGPVCPSCNRSLPAGAKICIACGIDIKSGRGLVMSRGFDEDDFAEKAREVIRRVSWFLPLNLLPIASEAWGTRKPKAVWTITAITIIVSIFYFPVVWEWGGKPSASAQNLMQWSGNRDALVEEFARVREKAKDELRDELTAEREAEQGNKPMTLAERQEMKKQQKTLERMVNRELAKAMPPPGVEFHWWQLFTSSLLHADFFHLAGNMLFLLVFGLRVNELVGNAKMAVLYPLLAVASAAAHHIASANGALGAYLGASGAIMGLAGMYFVLFPAQKVRMAFWIRLWPLPYVWWHKIFRLRGFWMLVLWIGFNDLLPMWLKSEDQVAHWAHLGGFMTGVVVALVLLITRLSSARGTDLLSLILGKRAWAIVGKPAAA